MLPFSESHDTGDLDPMLNAFRPDLADRSLAHQVLAERYVEPQMRQCRLGVLSLFSAPSLESRCLSQIRYGEFIDVFEFRDDGFVWAQNRTDRSVGYIPVPTAGLTDEIGDLSYRVTGLLAPIYKAPTPDAPIVDTLTLGCYVQPRMKTGDFWPLANGGYIASSHITQTSASLCPDIAFTAGRLLGVPYRAGGRTSMGLDTAGLVQLSLAMAGIEDAPHGLSQMHETIGSPLPDHWRDMQWRRGDIVFFSHHVGIMTSPTHLIHADPAPMQVVVTALGSLVERRGEEIIGIGRIE